MFEKDNKQVSSSDVAGGMAFVGSLLIGVGLGLAYVNMAVSILVSLGIGFILFAFVKMMYRT